MCLVFYACLWYDGTDYWTFPMLIGYCRVSTDDQTLDLQRDALQVAGCEKIFEETRPAGPRRIDLVSRRLWDTYVRATLWSSGGSIVWDGL